MYRHKRVLVALDGSPTGESVLPLLMEVAGPLDMTVTLLHVLEPIMPQAIEGTRHFTVEDVEARRRDAEAYLEPIAAAMRAKGVDTTVSIRYGQPVQEILAASAESGADLIAMATHGRTGLGRLLLGSVAEAVLRQAPVPVFIIRQPHAVAVPSGPREAPSR
jgi:nucleotide-binding universal stress UspA family protein